MIRWLTSIACGASVTPMWWFVELEISGPFDDTPSRLLWLFITAFLGVMCYTYPGWYD